MGLLLVNQAVRAMFYKNFIFIFFIILCIIYSYKFISLIKLRHKIIFTYDDVIIFITSTAVLFYSIFSLYITGFYNFIFTLTLMSLFFIFLIGRTLNLQIYTIIINVILVVGFAESLMLVINRSYMYESHVNYLLLSLTVGLFTCFTLLKIYFSDKILKKIFYLCLFFIGWLALFNMQSRTVFIIVALYSILLPFFISSPKNKLKFIIYFAITIFISIFIFYDEIINLYDHAVIYKRMFDLFYNFQDEPRFVTYGLYFNNFNNFFFTGYGTNGTALGIYKNAEEIYPHNFILEFISEFGILGFLFSFFFIFKSLYIIWVNKRKNFYILSILTMYFYYLINFMKSFSIYDAYVLFFSVGLIFNRELINSIKTSIKEKNV